MKLPWKLPVHVHLHVHFKLVSTGADLSRQRARVTPHLYCDQITKFHPVTLQTTVVGRPNTYITFLRYICCWLLYLNLHGQTYRK